MNRPGTLAFGLLAFLAGPAGDGPVLLEDFEAPALAAEWGASGATIRRVPAGTGGALEVSAWKPDPDRDTVVERRFPVRDLRRFESFVFTAVRSGGPLDTEVDFRAGDGRRLLWTRVRIEAGSKEVVLPLRAFMDDSRGLLGSFEAVDRVQFRWEKPSGTLVLDDLRLLPGKRGDASCRMSPEDWLAVGFGAGKGKAIPGKSFVLLTDRRDYQGPKGAKVLASLEEVLPVLADRFALKPAAGEKAPFFLVGDGGALGNLALDIAKAFGAERDPLPGGSGSFVVLGTGGACLGTDGQFHGPLVQHQAVHLVAARSLRFGTGSDWIQEALASSVGRRLTPEYFDMPGIPWRRVSAESFRLALAGSSSNLLPLSKLLSPEGDQTMNHIEFASLGDYLSSRHRAKLPAAWEALRAMEKPPYEAALEVLCGALGMTPAEFEADWMKWGAANFK